MNIRIGLKTILTAFSLLTMPASATTLTLDFDEFEGDDVDQSGGAAGAPAGPVRFINANHGVYDTFLPSILLGDDGWDSSISFNANAGYVFDAVSLRFINGWRNVYKAPVTGAVDVDDVDAQIAEAMRTDSLTRLEYENVAFTGYRDGAVVAMQMETYGGGPPSEFSFSDAFMGLDRLMVEVKFGGAFDIFPIISGSNLLYCPNERCGILEFDDLVLNVLSEPGSGPTAVPLPASALMLGSALFGISIFGRRKNGRSGVTILTRLA